MTISADAPGSPGPEPAEEPAPASAADPAGEAAAATAAEVQKLFGPDLAVRETEAEALANLRKVLTLVGRGKLKCSENSRRPSEITVRMVQEVLVRGDYYPDEEIAGFAWPLLLLSGGLALLDGPWMRPTARGRTLPAAEEPDLRAALAGLWTRWLTKAPIDELMRVDAIRGQRIPATLTAPTKRRAAVAAGLSALPLEGWVPVDRLLRIVRDQEPPLVVPRSADALWRLYLEDPDQGSLGHPGFGDWDILEGRYALCVVFEYAATLGLLDLVYRDPEDARDDFRQNWGVGNYRYLSRYDGLVAVRRTALGTSVFNPALAPARAEPKMSTS
ncbi:MAG TPA: hypothetical protein VGX23_32915 [Actinocrinis sp.]|nr:hypothetical protein [Actinocrinis sp.]